MHKMLDIQRSMLEALQTFVTRVASWAEEGVKKGGLSRAKSGRALNAMLISTDFKL